MLNIFRFHLFIILLIIPFAGTGQDNTIKFSNLDIQDGLSQSSVNDLEQDNLGFIWLATQDGLNRFDGYSFKVFKNRPGDTTSISDNFIHTLFEDADGVLWIGTENGLNRFNRNKGTFNRFQPRRGNFVVTAITDGVDDILWVGTQNAGLYKFDRRNGRFERVLSDITGDGIQALYYDQANLLWVGTTGRGLICFDAASGKIVDQYTSASGDKSITNDLVWAVTTDKKGVMWIGTNSGLNSINTRSGKVESYKTGHGKNSLSHETIKTVLADSAGNIWAGTDGGGLNMINPRSGEVLHFIHQGFVGSSLINNSVYALLEDRSGIIWAGTNRGASRFDISKQHFIHYRHVPYDPASISSDIVWALYSDEQGGLLVGNDRGLDVLSSARQRTETITPGDASPGSGIYTITRDHKGVFWLGADAGIYKYVRGSRSMQPLLSDGETVAGTRVYTLVTDHNNWIWAGTREGLFVISPDRKRSFRFRENESGLQSDVIRALHLNSNGDVLIGSSGGGLAAGTSTTDTAMLTPYGPGPEALNRNLILSLEEDRFGNIWIGTYGGGVVRYDPATKKRKIFTEEDGLSNNVVYSIYAGKSGKLWMSTNRGISTFDPATGKMASYFQNDGLQSNEFNIGAHFQSEDGELFFGGINGFNAFYPENIVKNTIAPSVVITGLQIFNRAVEPGSDKILSTDISVTDQLILSYRDDVITLEYAGLHFGSPEQNRYAYILEGFEENWNYVGDRRQVTYTNLDPGKYTFKVKASNSDGVWSQHPATLSITIKPPFWQTWWFRIISMISILVVAWGLYKSRIAIIEAQKRNLETMVLRRTEKIMEQKEKIEAQKLLIETEKEKVEKLLLNILPQETVDELKSKGKASARHYRMATVMFTDFKSFTQISERIRPKDLVAELDRYFIKFDEIVEKYGLEKIKTIGDAYMCAGGIPIRNKSNPIDTVLAALEIQRYMITINQEKKEKGEAPWELRIGIHTGELIAGVVGIKRFAYDIWGDTVNVASRMESNSEVGKVNVSGVTYQYIKDLFICEHRGKVNAKNKGDIDMYFVERIRSEMSRDEDGLLPNDLFRSTVANALFYKINYKKAEQFILRKLEEELPQDLYYHGLHHTIDVRDAAERIGKAEGITGEDLMVLKTAAMYHDAGFVKQYFKNEPIGVAMAKEILPDFGYSPQQINQVEELIMATQVPQKARNLMEMIICDADLDYLGRDDFHSIAETLKRELMARGKIKSDKEWDAVQISFLEHHRYFTTYSRNHRDPVKQIHIEEIKQRYAADRYEDKPLQA